MHHMQWHSKIRYKRVKCRVKEGNGEISVTEKVKMETIRTNYVHRVKYLVVVQLHVWNLKEEYCRHVYHWSLRITWKYETG